MSLVAISVGIFVLLGMENIRQQARDSFASTVSNVDLIVGARSGSINLLLYSVFRIGAPTNNISWESYETIMENPAVAWAIPLSLGDSHRGYRVLGTTAGYFEHFRYGDKRELEFAEGGAFNDLFEVVLGADVAKRLGYQLQSELVMAHGIADASFSTHDDKPFRVVGILAPTGTPVDQTLHVSLHGLEAMHHGWQHGEGTTDGSPREHIDEGHLRDPENITAFMLGLTSRMDTFAVQRDINKHPAEPLTAILPGVALSELWQVMGLLENILRLVAALVLVSALLGLGAMLLASVRERQHEIALLRMIGAPPVFLFLLIQVEALLICFAGIALGGVLLTLCFSLGADYLMSQFGLSIDATLFTIDNVKTLLIFVLVTVFAAFIPAIAAYRKAGNR